MKLLVSSIVLLSFLLNLSATNYYFDFNAANDSANGLTTGTPQKRAPGMTGYGGSITPAAGDSLIFKGGVTWTSGVYPWVIGTSGTAGSNIKYTTDRSWFTGGSFAQPIFDDGGTKTASGMLQGTSKRNFWFHDLCFTNYGVTQTDDGGESNMINLDSCQDFRITGCIITPYIGRAIYLQNNSGGALTNVYLESNIVSHCASLVWWTTGGAGGAWDTCYLNWNQLFDGASQLRNGVHGDGLVHFFSTPNFSVNQPFTNFVAMGNQCYGDWRTNGSGTTGGGMTAFLYNEAVLSIKIQDNLFYPYPVQANMFEGFIVCSAANGAKVEIYNNTLLNPGTSSASAGITGGAYNSAASVFKVTNNIVSGFTFAVYYAFSDGTVTTDYNVFNSGGGQLAWSSGNQSYATWQSAGRDTHSVLGSDPLLVDDTGPTFDLRLQSSSPAKDAGVVIAGRSIDFVGTAVPQGSLPDIGAYEFVTPATAYRGFQFGSGVKLLNGVTIRQ